MAGPLVAKKIKTDSIFGIFYHDERCMRALEDAIDSLRREFYNYGFCLLKLLHCNGHRSMPFSHADCDVSRNTDGEHWHEKMKSIMFSTIFEPGFRTIESYIDNPQTSPDKKGARIALQRLLEFIHSLQSISKECQKAFADDETSTDTGWAARFAHHLLSLLAANPSYVLDDHKPLTSLKTECPCCGETLCGTFDDTSVGASSIWHGHLDIILGKESNKVPVTFAVERAPDFPNGCEIKLSEHLDELFFMQVISETIVFSFLRRNQFPYKDNVLVPTLCVARDHVHIFLYDSEADVLLQSNNLPLFKDRDRKHLSLPTVVAVWCAVNYKYCCTTTPESVKELDFTADFQKIIGPAIRTYQKDVRQKCESRTKDCSYEPRYVKEYI